MLRLAKRRAQLRNSDPESRCGNPHIAAGRINRCAGKKRCGRDQQRTRSILKLIFGAEYCADDKLLVILVRSILRGCLFLQRFEGCCNGVEEAAAKLSDVARPIGLFEGADEPGADLELVDRRQQLCFGEETLAERKNVLAPLKECGNSDDTFVRETFPYCGCLLR